MSIGAQSAGLANAASGTRGGPVIVLAYAGSGAGRLRSLLSSFPGMACSVGTGIVPLCDQAMTAWQAADGRPGGGFSALAAASVRTFTAGLMTAILARDGGGRWCEVVSAPPAAAGAFARLYPQARFLAVHHRADTVVPAILDASRWGLSSPEFAPFVSAHPASTVAALASYWAARTGQQLEFEQAHPGSCQRVRIEDLTADPAQSARDIGAFLAADTAGSPLWRGRDQDLSGPTAAEPPPPGLPLDRIPASLLAQVNDLHRSLGYPPAAPARE
jgi:hypothetical protein